jgi:hypothetical protein
MSSLLICRRFGQHRCQVVAFVAFRRRQVAVHVTAQNSMDAEDTENQKKIRELLAVVAKGKKGINECRYQTDCEFARDCPGTC